MNFDEFLEPLDIFELGVTIQKKRRVVGGGESLLMECLESHHAQKPTKADTCK